MSHTITISILTTYERRRHLGRALVSVPMMQGAGSAAWLFI